MNNAWCYEQVCLADISSNTTIRKHYKYKITQTKTNQTT